MNKYSYVLVLIVSPLVGLYYEKVFICAGTDCLAPGRAVL